MEGVQDVEDHMAEEDLPGLLKTEKFSILESFSSLESSGESLRIDAGVALLQQLFDKQRENEVLCTDLNYTLTRLIRGMGTLNNGKRCGYFSALVGILSQFPEITLNDVLTKMEKEFSRRKNCPKSEVTEVYGGLILVCGAVVQSGLFFKGSREEQKLLLEKLLSAGAKKSIFAQAVSSFFVDICIKVDKHSFKKTVWPYVEKHLIRPWSACTADTLYMLVTASKQYSKMPKEKLIEVMGTSDVVNENVLPHICGILMNTPVIARYEHPVHEAVCCAVVANGTAFIFWEICVSDYQKRPNRSRELVLLVLLHHLVKHYPDKGQLFQFMSSGFMELTVKAFQTMHLKSDIVTKLCNIFSTLSGLLENDSVKDKSRISFIKCILLHPGNVMFEKLSGSKIVYNLCSCLKLKGLKKVADLYCSIIMAENPKKRGASGENLPWKKAERIYAALALTRLLSLPIVQENLDWKVDQVKFLISVGLIASPTRDGDIVHFAVAGKVKECIYKVLDQRMPKLDQLRSFLSCVVNYLHDIMFSPGEHGKIRQPLTDSSIAAWHRMVNVVQHLTESENKEGQQRGSIKRWFHVLFLHMGLQLFNNADIAEEALQELHCCYERINESAGLSSKKKSTKSVKDLEQLETEEPYWADVVVDLFLSLLSLNSHLLRNVVNVVFPHLCPHITVPAFHQILQVLNPHGKRPLSSTESGESGADKSESEEDDDNAEDDADDESDESPGEEDNEDEPVNLHLKTAVQNALGQVDGGSDAESIDVDDISEEDGRKLDAALSEAFKLLKHTQADNKKKRQSKDDETLMHFRVRVLDLLDLYMNTQPSLALILDMLLPLFELLEFCIKDPYQQPLESKIRSCLRKLLNVKHVANREGVDQQLLSDVLKALLQKGERAAAVFQSMGVPLVTSCTFLIRASYQLAQEQPSVQMGKKSNCPVEQVYREVLSSFFERRDSLLPCEVFKLALRLQWNGAWTLIPDIVDFAFNPNIRPFRRHQALELLLVFYSNCRLLNDASEKQKKILQHVEEKLSKETISVLTNTCALEDNGRGLGVKGRYMKELFHFLTVLWQAQKRYKYTKESVDWLAVKNAVISYREASACTRETKLTLKKLASILGISAGSVNKTALSDDADEVNIKTEVISAQNGVSMKRNFDFSSNVETSVQEDCSNTENESGVDGGENANRKRRKKAHSKDKALRKKMSREARVAAMAEGLDSSFSFTQLPVANITEEPNQVVEKKRKHGVDVQNGYVNGEVKDLKVKKAKKKKRT